MPAVAREPVVGLEQARGDPDARGGAPERVRLGRLRVEGHDQRVLCRDRRSGRVAPVVGVGERGPPGPEQGRGLRDLDARLPRALPVREGGAGRGVVRHGAVDRETRGLAHLPEERVLHGLLAGRQDELQVRAVADVGADGPGGPVHGLDRGQADRQRQAVEVEVGVVPAAAAVPEDAEGEAAPELAMDGAVEEGAARKLRPGVTIARRAVVEDRGQGEVQRGVGGGAADRGDRLRRREGDRRAVRERRGVVGKDGGLGLAQEVLRRERDAPAGHGLPVRGARARGDGAAPAREAGEAEARRVLAPDELLRPAVLAEAQQHGGIGDALAVVGDRDRDAGLVAVLRIIVREDRDADARGAGPAGVLQGLGQDLGEGGGVGAGDAPDGAFVDSGADRRARRCGTGVHGGRLREWEGKAERPAGWWIRRAVAASCRGPVSRRCGGTRGSPPVPPTGRGRWPERHRRRSRPARRRRAAPRPPAGPWRPRWPPRP